MKSKKPKKISPEEAVDFLEAFQKMQAGIDDPTKAISLRVPANILLSYKTLAKAENRSYQTMMIQALREFIRLK